MKLLSEILNQPYDYKLTRQIPIGKNGHTHMYNFKSPNDKYEIEFSKSPNSDHSHLVFGSDKGGYGISGAEKENPHRIFSTVVHATKHYLQNNPNVKGLHFTGEKDKKGRNGVYGMLAKKFANNVTTSDKKDPNSDYSFRSYHIKREDMKGLDG